MISKRKKYGDNSRRCGIDKFDRNNTYGKIVDIIDKFYYKWRNAI